MSSREALNNARAQASKSTDKFYSTLSQNLSDSITYALGGNQTTDLFSEKEDFNLNTNSQWKTWLDDSTISGRPSRLDEMLRSDFKAELSKSTERKMHFKQKLHYARIDLEKICYAMHHQGADHKWVADQFFQVLMSVVDSRFMEMSDYIEISVRDLAKKYCRTEFDRLSDLKKQGERLTVRRDDIDKSWGEVESFELKY